MCAVARAGAPSRVRESACHATPFAVTIRVFALMPALQTYVGFVCVRHPVSAFRAHFSPRLWLLVHPSEGRKGAESRNRNGHCIDRGVRTHTCAHVAECEFHNIEKIHASFDKQPVCSHTSVFVLLQAGVRMTNQAGQNTCVTMLYLTIQSFQLFIT